MAEMMGCVHRTRQEEPRENGDTNGEGTLKTTNVSSVYYSVLEKAKGRTTSLFMLLKTAIWLTPVQWISGKNCLPRVSKSLQASLEPDDSWEGTTQQAELASLTPPQGHTNSLTTMGLQTGALLCCAVSIC